MGKISNVFVSKPEGPEAVIKVIFKHYRLTLKLLDWFLLLEILPYAKTDVSRETSNEYHFD